MTSYRRCTEPGCPRSVYVAGERLCSIHRRRLRLWGTTTPNVPEPPRRLHPRDDHAPLVCFCAAPRPTPGFRVECQRCHRPIVALMHGKAALEAYARWPQLEAQEVEP